jgi:hypothetical protein
LYKSPFNKPLNGGYRRLPLLTEGTAGVVRVRADGQALLDPARDLGNYLAGGSGQPRVHQQGRVQLGLEEAEDEAADYRLVVRGPGS